MALEDVDIDFTQGSFRDLANLVYSRLSGRSPREFAYLHRKVKRKHVKVIISQYAFTYGWKFAFQYHLHGLDPLLGKRRDDTFARWYQRKKKASESHTPKLEE